MAKTRRIALTINEEEKSEIGPRKYAIADLKKFKRGDRVWFQLSDYDETIGTGKITEIYNFPESGICVSVWEDKFGAWRCYPISKISLKKLRQKKKKVNNEFQDFEFSVPDPEE